MASGVQTEAEEAVEVSVCRQVHTITTVGRAASQKTLVLRGSNNSTMS